MNNTVVILIDSGIDISAFKEDVVGGKHFFAKDGQICQDDNYNDDNGHGTACAYIIKSIFSSAKFYVIKVLDKCGETVCPILEAALTYCLEIEYKIVNLSLTILEGKTNQVLEAICDQLKGAGKIVISAVCNGYKESYPAAYHSIIGVRGGRLRSSEDYWFNTNKAIQCIADLSPAFTDRSLERFFLFGGNSKACALMSGQILRTISIRNIKIDWKNVNSILANMAVRRDWNEDEILISTGPLQTCKDSLCDEMTLKVISQALKRSTGLNQPFFLQHSDNLFEKGILHPQNIRRFVFELEKQLGFRIPNSHITFDSFCSLCMICTMIEDVYNEKNQNDD